MPSNQYPSASKATRPPSKFPGSHNATTAKGGVSISSDDYKKLRGIAGASDVKNELTQLSGDLGL